MSNWYSKVKDWQLLFIVGAVILLMAYLERRVRFFYLIAFVVIGIGFYRWIVSEKPTEKNEKQKR